MNRKISAALGIAVLAAVAAAQNQTFFSEVIEVRVTNVDVIVTGRDGKPVTGLKKEDFEIYENGVKKEISNFLELRGEPAAALAPIAPQPDVAPASQDIRRRDVTIFIDNSAIHPFRRNEILGQVQAFVDHNVRPGDTVSLASWGNGLQIDLEPTSDRSAVAAVVKRLASQSEISKQGRAKEEYYARIGALIRTARQVDDQVELPPWSSAIAEARTLAMALSHDLNQRIEAVKSVIAWRRGVDGRKILVLVTSEFDQFPAYEEFAYLDTVKDKFADSNTMAIGEAKEFEFRSLVTDITTVANSAGVTLYPIDAAGKEAGIADRSANATRLPMAGAPMTPALRAIAADTGGIAITGSDNWKLAFDTISNDLETYYSLGYRSEGERQDRMKNIEVRLKNRKYSVRTRRAVIERSIESEMQDAVASNLFRPAANNDLAIRAAAGAANAGGETVVVPLTVTIPIDKLTLVPEGSDLTGRFALYAAFLRNDGAVSKVAQQPQSFRFPADSLKRRKDLTVKFEVTADSRTSGVSIGLMDELSLVTGFASVRIGV